MFLWVAIAIWLGAVLAWWICSKAFRQADLERLKTRLLGVAKTKKKSSKDAPALIQSEARGGLLVGLMTRFRLQSRTRELLEQAGLKWHPSRLIHLVDVFLLGRGPRGMDVLAGRAAPFVDLAGPGRERSPAPLRHAQTQSAVAALRGAIPGKLGIRVPLHARRTRLLGIA